MALSRVLLAATLLGAAQAAVRSKITGRIVPYGQNPNAPVVNRYKTGKFITTNHHNGPFSCPYETERLDCQTVTSCTYHTETAEQKAACPKVPHGLWHRMITQTCMCVKHAPVPTCTGGQIFATCASACTPTCKNLHPICTNECRRRCACPATTPVWDPVLKQCVKRSTCAEAALNGKSGACHEDEEAEKKMMFSKKFGCGKELQYGWWYEHGHDALGRVEKTFARNDSKGHRITVAEAKQACDMMGQKCVAFVIKNNSVKILSAINDKVWMGGKTAYADGVYYKPVCPTPLHPAQGTYEIIGGGVGAMAKARCGPGYALVGSAVQKCQVDGTWSGTTPYCERNKCLDPPVLKHYGKVLLEGKTATYSCDPGFALTGSRVRTCKDGKWSGTQPECKLSCGHTYPAPPAHGVIMNDPHKDVYGSVVKYGCKEGFVARGIGYSQCRGEAGKQPVWTTPTFACKPVECSEPVQIAHAALSDNGPENYGEKMEVDYPVGRIAKYQCHTGYQMLGPQISTCLPNGKWSPVPVCVQFFQCKHTTCTMHDHSVQLHLIEGRQNRHMNVQHGSTTGHDARDSMGKHIDDTRHRCRYDKLAHNGKGACECICWHEDQLHAEQHQLASRVTTNSGYPGMVQSIRV